MGRVRVKDTGEPGKFYFTDPIVETIKGKPLPPTERTSNNVVTLRGETPEGQCRLASSHKIHNYTPPKNIIYALGEFPTTDEIKNYLTRAHVAGYGEGAVVTRRYQTKGRYKYHHQWGLIVVEVDGNSMMRKWAPFSVRWFLGSEVEPAWAEDLVVIHACLDKNLLDSIMEDQGVEI